MMKQTRLNEFYSRFSTRISARTLSARYALLFPMRISRCAFTDAGSHELGLDRRGAGSASIGMPPTLGGSQAMWQGRETALHNPVIPVVQHRA